MTALSASPAARAAHAAVTAAVLADRLPRADWLPCTACGAKAYVYHHPNGYDTPHELDVVALCVPCHSKAHRPKDRPPPLVPAGIHFTNEQANGLRLWGDGNISLGTRNFIEWVCAYFGCGVGELLERREGA